VNLSVDLGGCEGAEVSIVGSILTRFSKGSLDQTSDFLDVLLGAYGGLDLAGLNCVLLLNSKYQTYWDESLSKFANSRSIGLLGLHVLQ
jgi:hypothetical protein